MHLQQIGVRAQRFRLETVVELLQFRQLRTVWRRRGAGSSSSCSGKRSTDGGAASCPCIMSAAINSALEKISPYVFIAFFRQNVAEFPDAGSYVGARGFEPPTCRRGDRSTKLSLWSSTQGTPCFVALESPALWRRIRSVKFPQEPT